MTLTLSANASKLYKCRDWNFTGQFCYGNWEKMMDLEIGKDYNLILSNNDPGFIEAEIIDETGSISAGNATIYREQSDRTNTGQEMNISFVISNNMSYIDNLSVTDNI